MSKKAKKLNQLISSKVKMGKNISESFAFILGTLINVTIGSILVWQCIQCVTKFVEKPQGTTVIMQLSKNVSFPVITICGLFPFNKSYLEEICRIR